jgi:putative flavoprotein involved in K+ transport
MDLKNVLRKGQVRLKGRAIAAQGNVVRFADDSQIQEWSWIAIPEVLDESGQPKAHQGVSSVPGLFFLGVRWHSSRGSALVGWVGEDAQRFAEMLHTDVATPG